MAFLKKLSRWVLRDSDEIRHISHEGEAGAESARSGAAAQEECFACTQAQTPAFHSLSCDEPGHMHWQANAGSSVFPGGQLCHLHRTRARAAKRVEGILGKVLDPRSRAIQRWNRTILLTCAIGVAIDPLFFYVLSISKERFCIYIDGRFVVFVVVLRSATDAVHLWHIWLQFKLAYVSKESLVVGCGKLIWDAKLVALHYLRSLKGFWFDIFVILPVPQVIFWWVLPNLILKGEITHIMTVLLVLILFQYLPKVYHFVCLIKRMQRVTGYIFGTIWWGFAFNLITYFVASHVAGGCWYVLAIQRVGSCLRKQCQNSTSCDLAMLGCRRAISYSEDYRPVSPKPRGWHPSCLDADGPFPYGIYEWALPLVTATNWTEKILYPIFWGLMTLSTFGNDLEPTCHWIEVIFSIVIVVSGLLLFTLLIGNIQVFLHAVMQKKRLMQLKIRDLEWWMKRRQLPSKLRHRVRRFERQRWAATRGVDETEMIKDLPEGLRRDVKRHLCIDLISKVPLFQDMDALILENICDRAKPLIFTKGEKIVREGDPVQRMLFVVKGRVKCTQRLSKGLLSRCTVGPGGFCGEELLSWCLRRPFAERLPPSSATYESVESTEAFGVDALHLKYVTDHFRYRFANDRLRRCARYYSSSWRTWAAVTIQLAWRRHRHRRLLLSLSFSNMLLINNDDDNNNNVGSSSSTNSAAITPASSSEAEAASSSSQHAGSNSNPGTQQGNGRPHGGGVRGMSEAERLRVYAAMFMSPKPMDMDHVSD